MAALIPQSRTLVDETTIPALPARMTGAQIGNGLVNCATCHQGVIKPMNGANMVHDYPGLTRPLTAPEAAPHAEAIPAASPG